MIVSIGYGATELSIYAIWFGWLESKQSYAYQSENGTYFCIEV